MPTTVSLSRVILTLAAWVAPPGRRTLCQAMRAELDVLYDGRLSWALGGLVSALGWRLRVDGLFWAVVLACALPIWRSVTFLATVPIYRLLDRLGSPAIYSYWLLQQALVCALLAAWRPRLAAPAAITYLVVQYAISEIVWIYVLRWPTGKGVKIMDAPPVVGLSAVLCWCLIGAWSGASLRRTFARPTL
ncbi:hypothetical protein [Caulobacter sp. X]|uniref:hypothetical protein n=1 Tax=Caulobacter sp. X TaxID=2048901 RepID=UPI000C15F8D3|nr:hypothetical protein [Caulobacter sp. X]PIB95391.1 hypothetical protein CSW60_12315 [Caulobacter sp. X]